MSNVFRRSPLQLLLLLFLLSALQASSASAQEPTKLARQLNRLDLGLAGVGEFRSTVTGTNYQGVSLTQGATNAFGALVTIRYTRSPLVGAEFNYTFARHTETFSAYIGGVQANTSEYTVGYVAHAPQIFGVRPFGAAGAGVTAFSPTQYAGSGLPERARATYYYAVGAEAPVLTHVGIRAQFRELFFLAPDFGQNYLTITQHTTAIEPAVGIYLHF